MEAGVRKASSKRLAKLLDVYQSRPAFTRMLTREMGDEDAYMPLALCNAQGSEAAQQRRGLRL